MSISREMPLPLIDFFQERQEAFVNSLKKAVSVVANDDYIKQMFENKLSTTYIPDRVCELISRITCDDREKFITSLLEKLNSVEICFGEKRLDQFEEIGLHLNDLYTIPIFNEVEYEKQIQVLIMILKELENELQARGKAALNDDASLNNAKQKINKTIEIKKISSDIKNLKQSVIDLQNQTLLMMKGTLKKLRQNGSSQISPSNFSEDRKELLKTIENQSSQINQLTKQLQFSGQKQSPIAADKLTKRIEKAKVIIQQLSEDNNVLESNQKVLTEKNNHLKEIISRLKQQIMSNSGNKSILDLDPDDLSISSMKQNEIALSQELSKIKEENIILKQHNDRQKAKFNQRLRTLETELQQTRDSSLALQTQQNSAKDKQIKELSEQNKILINTIQNNEKQLLSKKHHQQKLREKLMEFSTANEEQNASIESLSAGNSTLIASIKKARRELRIQTQVNQELSQQIEELKKTFSKAEDEVRDAHSLISTRIIMPVQMGTLTEKIRGLFIQIDDEKTKRIELERANSKISSEIQAKEREYTKAQQTITKLTEQLKGNTQLRTQIDNQQSVLVESKSTIQQLSEKAEKFKEKSNDLFNTLKEVSAERDNLVEYKQLSEQLKKQNSELNKDLKNTKQKLAKQEADLQMVTSLSQRQYAEQLKDLSKQLREANNRIQRIHTQSSRSFPIESFDDIPNTLSDCKNQITKINSIMAKIKNILQVKNDDDVLNEVRNLKQDSYSLQDFLKEVSDILNVSSLKKCSKAIVDFKNEMDLFRSREEKVCQLLAIKDPIKIEKTLQSVIETNKTINKVYDSLCVKEEKLISDRVDELTSFETILHENGLFTNNLLEEHFQKYNTLIAEKKETMKKLQIINLSIVNKDDNGNASNEPTLKTNPSLNTSIPSNYIGPASSIADMGDNKKVFNNNNNEGITNYSNNNSNLEENVQKLIDHCRKLEKIATMLKIQENPNRIEKLLDYEAKSKEICSLLQISDEDEIIQSINELIASNNGLIEEEEKIMTALAVLTPDSIIPAIDDLSKQITDKTAIINNLCEKLKVNDHLKLNEKIMKFVAMEKEFKTSKKLLMSENLTESVRIIRNDYSDLKSLIEDINDLLKTRDNNQIKPTLQYILQENEEFHSIDILFPPQYQGSVKDRVSKILKSIKDNNEFSERLCSILKITKNEEIEKAVSSIIEGIRNASELFSEMLKSLLVTDIEINFPITKEEKSRLMNLFIDNKKRNDDVKLQVDLIFNKALSFGYRGTNCTEAVDAIVAAFSEADKHSLSEKLHEELMSVRAATEKEKRAAEKQKDKSQKIINKLKQNISELKESSIKTENELTQQLQNEKQKVIELASDLGNEQRIHKELMQLINGQVHDGKLLISQLSRKEGSLVKEAEETFSTLSVIGQEPSKKSVKFK